MLKCNSYNNIYISTKYLMSHILFCYIIIYINFVLQQSYEISCTSLCHTSENLCMICECSTISCSITKNQCMFSLLILIAYGHFNAKNIFYQLHACMLNHSVTSDSATHGLLTSCLIKVSYEYIFEICLLIIS